MNEDRVLINRVKFDLKTNIKDSEIDFYTQVKLFFYKTLLPLLEKYFKELNKGEILRIEKIEIDIGLFKLNPEDKLLNLHGILSSNIMNSLRGYFDEKKLKKITEESYLFALKELMIKGYSSSDYFLNSSQLSSSFYELNQTDRSSFLNFISRNFKNKHLRKRFLLQFNQDILDTFFMSISDDYILLHKSLIKFYENNKLQFIDIDKSSFIQVLNRLIGDFYLKNGSDLTSKEKMIIEIIKQSGLDLKSKKELLKSERIDTDYLITKSDLGVNDISIDFKEVTIQSSAIEIVRYYTLNHSLPDSLKSISNILFGDIIIKAIKENVSEFVEILKKDTEFHLIYNLIEFSEDTLNSFIFPLSSRFNVEDNTLYNDLVLLDKNDFIQIKASFHKVFSLLFFKDKIQGVNSVDNSDLFKLKYLINNRFIEIKSEIPINKNEINIKNNIIFDFFNSFFVGKEIALTKNNKHAPDEFIDEVDVSSKDEIYIHLTIDFFENYILFFIQNETHPWWSLPFLNRLDIKEIDQNSSRDDVLYYLLDCIRKKNIQKFNSFNFKFISNTFLRNQLLFVFNEKLQTIIVDSILPKGSFRFLSRLIVDLAEFVNHIFHYKYVGTALSNSLFFDLLPFLKNKEYTEDVIQCIVIKAYSSALDIDLLQFIKKLKLNDSFFDKRIGHEMGYSKLFIDSIDNSLSIIDGIAEPDKYLVNNLNKVESNKSFLIKALVDFSKIGAFKASIFNDFESFFKFYSALENSESISEQEIYNELKENYHFQILLAQLEFENDNLKENYTESTSFDQSIISSKNNTGLHHKIFSQLILIIMTPHQTIQGVIDTLKSNRIDTKGISKVISFLEKKQMLKNLSIDNNLILSLKEISTGRLSIDQGHNIFESIFESTIVYSPDVLSQLKELSSIVQNLVIDLDVNKDYNNEQVLLLNEKLNEEDKKAIIYYKESIESICENLNFFLIHLKLPWWSVYRSFDELQKYYSRSYKSNKYDLAMAFHTIAKNTAVWDRIEFYFNNSIPDDIPDNEISQTLKELLKYQFKPLEFDVIRDELESLEHSFSIIFNSKVTL